MKRAISVNVNIILAITALCGIVLAATEVSGFGTGVSVAYLEHLGAFDRDVACAADPRLCTQVDVGRFVAEKYILAVGFLAGVALAAAIVNLCIAFSTSDSPSQRQPAPEGPISGKSQAKEP